MKISLFLRVEKGETVREAVLRQGDKCGLRFEVMECYDWHIRRGYKEEDAAWHALYEWDCLDLQVVS